MHIHFCVQPYFSVEVVLWMCCVVIGVVTMKAISFNDFFFKQEHQSFLILSIWVNIQNLCTLGRFRVFMTRAFLKITSNM